MTLFRNLKANIFLSLIIIVGFFLSPNLLPLSHALDDYVFVSGVNWHPVWKSSSWVDQNISLMDQAGVQATRFDVKWCDIEPTSKGVYYQPALDYVDYTVNQLVAHKIDPLIVVTCVPGWANGEKNYNVPPVDNKDYADFVKYLVSRYTGKVKNYQIWDEPDGSWSWSSPDPAKYTKLLQQAYTKAKSADPSVKILGGSLYFSDKSFLSGMYEAGAKDYFDILAVHVYGDPPVHGNTTPDVPLDSIKTLFPIMSNFNDSNKDIWVTETGYNTSTGGVNQAVQADYLTQTYQYVKTIPEIKRLYWYDWIDDANTPSDPEKNYGVLTTTFVKKPAYFAYQQLFKPILKKGDINVDGAVNLIDYNQVVSDFLKTGSNLSSDLNKDGTVDLRDYNIVVSNFGK